MKYQETILYGLSAFKLLRVPPQVLALCPPLPYIRECVRKPELDQHPVVKEILGTPIHTLVTDRRDRRTAARVRTHLVSSPLPAGAIVPSALDVKTCSPLFTLLLLARHLSTVELAMAMYELCGEFSVFKPSQAIESLLESPEAESLSKKPGAWKRVRSAGKTSSGSKSSLWMRPPLIDLADLRAYTRSCPNMRGKARFDRAAAMVTGVASSPFEVQLSLLLSLPPEMGGMGMREFSNNAKIPLKKEARSIYPHECVYADLLFEGDGKHRPLDVECQGGIIHDNERQALSDTDRSTALAVMGVDSLGVTYGSLSDINAFHALAKFIASHTGFALDAPSASSRDREQELRRVLLIDWPTLGQSASNA